VRSSIAVPRPVAGLVAEDVYVMEWMDGDSVAAYMRSPHPLNTEVVGLGTDTYLKMLLTDNFVHTDLHPGNIKVAPAPVAPPPARGGRGGGAAPAACGGAKERARIVLLDFGLAEELTPEVRHRFISFLNQIVAGARAGGRAGAGLGYSLVWLGGQGGRRTRLLQRPALPAAARHPSPPARP
jgi:aarF domain-containing kinase